MKRENVFRWRANVFVKNTKDFVAAPKNYAIIKKMTQEGEYTMQYEGQICRPPMERASYMLPVAVGCSYNACTFCTLFKHLQYRQLPKEQIEAEMIRVHDAGGNPKTIFLGVRR